MKKMIAARLRKIRRDRGESQGEVAARLGISQQLLSRIERGETALEHLLGECRALGVAAEIRIGDEVFPWVHAMDPRERCEIEANLDWFSRLSPGDRLRAMRRQYLDLMKLQRVATAQSAQASRRGRGA